MEPIMYQDRAYAALQRITLLHAEQQRIYRSANRITGLSVSERVRLQQIMREIALAQDERNRARCGAPPTPPEYDPFYEPEVVQQCNTIRIGRGYRKTTLDEVVEMRRLFADEGLSATDIWRLFPYLKESTIRDILSNRTWCDPSYTPRNAEQESPPSKRVRDVVNKRTQVRGCDA